jgi:hypothetical protein
MWLTGAADGAIDPLGTTTEREASRRTRTPSQQRGERRIHSRHGILLLAIFLTSKYYHDDESRGQFNSSIIIIESSIGQEICKIG